jgi:N6-L-threonylcarbamoyladenine synthase
MLVHVRAPFDLTVLGQTRDDAAGEAFDKVAKMIGLGYPGGPVIDRRAREGDPRAISFPRSFLGEGYEFSFSGIKTAVLYHLRREGLPDPARAGDPAYERILNDICASFQESVVDVLVEKTLMAARTLGVRDIGIAGGVSANSRLREKMRGAAAPSGRRIFTPALQYCMDNGAMIAYVGWLRHSRGESSPFELPAVPNLSLS